MRRRTDPGLMLWLGSWEGAQSHGCLWVWGCRAVPSWHPLTLTTPHRFQNVPHPLPGHSGFRRAHRWFDVEWLCVVGV